MRIKKERDFISIFDEKTGNYIRTGIIKNGKITDTNPFMSSFPELIDIGIMGHCKHGLSGMCIKTGTECYQDGLHSRMDNMSLNNFRRIAQECEGKTFQFALGGCGDPDQHEHFEEILEICAEYNIVPNFTTSGFGMNNNISLLCKKYCGAVAVSWYRTPYTIDAINMLLEAGVKTNIHFVINKRTIGEAIELLEYDNLPKGINAIIFLLHKPVGLGSHKNMLDSGNLEFKLFLKRINEGAYSYRIGFDSCTIPSLISNCSNIEIDCLDTCEGARWSAYITPDMKFLPCSFDNQEQRWAVNLDQYSIQEAWWSDSFTEFRNHLKNACPDCKKRIDCMGGCPICPEIVVCNLKPYK